MGLFDPWLIGQSGGGLLGGLAPAYTQADINALLDPYGARWGGLPPSMLPAPNGDPNAGRYEPLHGKQQMPYEYATRPVFPDLPSQAPSLPQPAQATLAPNAGFWESLNARPAGAPPSSGGLVRPGSFFDRLLNPAQPSVQPSTNPADYAGLADAFGPVSAPQAVPATAVPLPRPRPAIDAPDEQLPPGATPTIGNAAELPFRSAPQTFQEAPLPNGPGDRLSAGFQGFMNAGSPMQAIGNLVGGLATGQRQDPAGQAQANQAQMAQALYGALRQRGISHEQAVGIASAASKDPKMAEVLLPQALGLKPPTTVEGVIAERLSGQNRGGVPVTDIGSGLSALEQLEQAKARGTKAGGTEGERVANAQLDLPGAVAQANEGLRLIQELRKHKGRDNWAFWHSKSAAYLPDSAIPGNTDARDAMTILGQIKGGAFLEAFKTLKGGGQITEVEGKKATDAIARMDRSQSRAEFDKALSDYEGIIRLGIDRANQQAGRPAPNEFRGNAVKPGSYDWTPGGGMRQRQ